jgi:hypothetical protein
LDRIVADARRAAEERQLSYRERPLKIHPWVFGPCARAFARTNLREQSRATADQIDWQSMWTWRGDAVER